MSEVGLIIRQRHAPSSPRPFLFLDRDGVIVEDVHHLRRVEDIRILPGIASLIRQARKFGMGVGIVTNQSGIDRGLFDAETYHRVADAIDAALERDAVDVDVTVACPFHPEHTIGYGTSHAHMRKPGPGMIALIADRYAAVTARSLIVGDRLSDMQAGKAAGLPLGLFVGEREAITEDTPGFQIHRCVSVEDAAAFLTQTAPRLLQL